MRSWPTIAVKGKIEDGILAIASVENYPVWGPLSATEGTLYHPDPQKPVVAIPQIPPYNARNLTEKEKAFHD
jgi:hypothetical protein